MKIIGIEFRCGLKTMGQGNLPEVALFPVEIEFPEIHYNEHAHSIQTDLVGDFTIHTSRGDRQVPQFDIGYLELVNGNDPLYRGRAIAMKDYRDLDRIIRNTIKYQTTHR